MSVEREPSPQTDFGSLQGCFVEGNGEQRARERRIRRRALIISVATQSVIVAAVILVPLFGKPERVALAYTPVPPYYHSSSPERDHPQPVTPTRRHFVDICITCEPRRIPDHVSPNTDNDPTPPDLIPGTDFGPGTKEGPCPGCIPLNDGRGQPERPAEVKPPTKRIVVTHLEPAMLINRVEPIYPPLARQTRREGKVELRAIIATDGAIQSLQVVSGDALFLQSALTAVRQWRYRATVLNGQPVEIDTYITVVYTLQH
ncbi:MAG TPA: energy transducer TonB [Candidatus Acidoferrum sp.]|nr:energy transducer TonB [Candidatus Acidoferrum sp.]